MSASKSKSLRVTTTPAVSHSGFAESAAPYVASSDTLAQKYGLSKTQLAQTIGLSPETLQKSARSNAQKTQARLREMSEILLRVTAWAGGSAQALAWYRAEPIPAFGGRTAESLVKTGEAAFLRDYLDSVAVGGFA
jgi:transcriptional regulator with XRE-family HTH domain